MKLLDDLLTTIPDGELQQLIRGRLWTVSIVKVQSSLRAGLAPTILDPKNTNQRLETALTQASNARSGRALARLTLSDQEPLAAIGLATLNALLTPPAASLPRASAEELIAAHGAGKQVVIVGHFHFVDRLRPRVGKLSVIERRPQPGDLPEEAAAEVIPQAEVVAITGMTLLNHTLENLLALCSPGATVFLVGPSACLSPLVHDHGVDIICGSLVTDIPAVAAMARAGGDFRALRQTGVRRVAMIKQRGIEG